jgi:hypothetical protein
MNDSGQDLVLALRKARNNLIDAVNDMKSSGRFLATAERDYRVALCKEMLKMRAEDKIAWTALFDLAVGNKEVADLRFKRDVHNSDYDVSKECINQLKLEIRLLEKEIEQEWGKA